MKFGPILVAFAEKVSSNAKSVANSLVQAVSLLDDLMKKDWTNNEKCQFFVLYVC